MKKVEAIKAMLDGKRVCGALNKEEYYYTKFGKFVKQSDEFQIDVNNWSANCDFELIVEPLKTSFRCEINILESLGRKWLAPTGDDVYELLFPFINKRVEINIKEIL